MSEISRDVYPMRALSVKSKIVFKIHREYGKKNRVLATSSMMPKGRWSSNHTVASYRPWKNILATNNGKFASNQHSIVTIFRDFNITQLTQSLSTWNGTQLIKNEMIKKKKKNEGKKILSTTVADILSDCGLMVAMIYALKRYCQRQHSSRFFLHSFFSIILPSLLFSDVIIELQWSYYKTVACILIYVWICMSVQFLFPQSMSQSDWKPHF